MAVLHLLGLIVPLELAEFGAGQHVLHRLKFPAPDGRAEIHPGQHVVRVLLVDGGEAFGHGPLRLQGHGVLLVLHPDQLEGLMGGDQILRHHGGDVVPVDDKKVDCKEVIDIIIFSYQGVRMYSTIIPLDEEIPMRIINHIKKTLLV